VAQNGATAIDHAQIPAHSDSDISLDAPGAAPIRRADMKILTPKGVTILIVALLLVIFAFQNSEVLQVNFLFFKFETSRVALIAIALLGGILVGRLTATWPRRKADKNDSAQQDV
jgi:uncharacterized integral membrane protein